MSRHRGDQGFTLVETLVAVALFSVLSAGFYVVMFSQVRGSERTQATAAVSQEARLGFNRLIRDTREGSGLSDAGCNPGAMENGDCYNVKVDFNNDGLFQNPNAAGDYENVTFVYDDTEETISIVTCNGVACPADILMTGVEPVPGRDVFTFESNLLAYDTNSNGITSWQELDVAPTDVGDGDGDLTVGEWRYLSSVSIALQITSEGGETTKFFGEAQLRNRRFGE